MREWLEHVKTYERVLRDVDALNEGIFDDPGLVWTMDNSIVDCEYGTKEMSLSGSSRDHGGAAISMTLALCEWNGHVWKW